jgi:DNA invertase Pin-like site-specific DNA recombinase
MQSTTGLKMVNPSGERDDRPRFLAMLTLVETGEPDVILCWRGDRLLRHPRVAATLEDSLDAGDKVRGGKQEIKLYSEIGN